MIAERDRGWSGAEAVDDILRLPGVLALRVTIRSNPEGYAWCADASVGCGLPVGREAPRPTPNAAGDRDTRALDELFSAGL
jgi:hypothetical protein